MAYGGLLDILQGLLGQGQGYGQGSGQDQGNGLLAMMQQQQQGVPNQLATDDVRAGTGILSGGYGTDRLLGADIGTGAAPAAAGAGAATANAAPLAPAAGGGGGLLSGLFGGGTSGGAGGRLLGGIGGWVQKNPAAIDALVTGFANIGNKNVGNPFLYGANQAAPEFKEQRLRNESDDRKAAMKSALIKLGYPADLAEAGGKVPELGNTLVTSALRPKDPKGPFAVGNNVYDPASGKFISGPNAGGYEGTSMDAQNWNIIQTADPSSQRYANAYNQLFEQPKLQPVQTNEGLTYVPTMPTVPAGVKKPTVAPSGGGAPATFGTGITSGGVGDAGTAPSSTAPSTTTTGGAPAVAPSAAPGVAPNIGAPIVIPGTQAKPNEAQIRDAKLYSVIEPELKVIDKHFESLSQLGNQIGGLAPGGINRFLTSEQYQLARGSVETIVSSYLYSVSGATATPAEVKKQADLLMPAPGEKPASIAQKLQRIHTMADSVKSGAGSAAKTAPTYTPEGLQEEKRRRQGLR